MAPGKHQHEGNRSQNEACFAFTSVKFRSCRAPLEKKRRRCCKSDLSIEVAMRLQLCLYSGYQDSATIKRARHMRNAIGSASGNREGLCLRGIRFFVLTGVAFTTRGERLRFSNGFLSLRGDH